MGKLTIRYQTRRRKKKRTIQTDNPILNLSARALKIDKPDDKFTSIDLSPLQEFTSLQVLDLTGHLLEGLDLSPLESCQGLKTLRLGLNKLQYLDLSPLSSCTALQSLDLRYNALERLNLEPLGSHPALEYLLLAGNPLKYLNISPLFRCRRLKRFTYEGILAASEGLRDLPKEKLPEGVQWAMLEVHWLKTEEDKLEEYGRKILMFQKEQGRLPDLLEAYGKIGVPEELYSRVLAYIEDSQLGESLKVSESVLEKAGQQTIAYGLERKRLPTIADLVVDLGMGIPMSHATLAYLEKIGFLIDLADSLGISDSTRVPTESDGRCLVCTKEVKAGSAKCLTCGESRHRCLLCKRYISLDDEFLKCPNCDELSHRTHLLEWIRVKGSCPNCRTPLRPKDVE